MWWLYDECLETAELIDGAYVYMAVPFQDAIKDCAEVPAIDPGTVDAETFDTTPPHVFCDRLILLRVLMMQPPWQRPWYKPKKRLSTGKRAKKRIVGDRGNGEA